MNDKEADTAATGDVPKQPNPATDAVDQDADQSAIRSARYTKRKSHPAQHPAQETKMEISKAMHENADWVSADTPVSEIANMMKKEDIGAVPIGNDDKLVGMITDRDIALRVVAAGRDPEKTKSEDVMTKGIVYCRTTETVEDAIHLMDQKKIRRLPVLDDKKRLVGMLSLGDVAHSVSRDLSGELLHAVSDHHK